jgi:hypothetical protein
MPRLMGTDSAKAVNADSWRGERFFVAIENGIKIIVCPA